MSQAPPETIEQGRVYCTNALVKRVGRAIAISLEDATLPGNARNKHMVVFYRGDTHFTDNEIELMSKEADNWIKQQYGNNKAPITFTINRFGRNSVKIEGDLYDLCIYLRNKLPEMSNDKQRIPHCKLFTKGYGNLHNNKNIKCCHICGDPRHYKRNCPQREHKTFSKKKGWRNSNVNIEQRLQRMILKTTEFKQEKLNEIKLLDEQTQKLQILLNNINNLDGKTLKNEIKNIANEFKGKRKEMKRNKKCVKRQRKYDKKEMKYQGKEQKKLEKMKRKMDKKETHKFEEKQEEFVETTNDKDEFVDIIHEIEGYNVTPNNDDSDDQFTSIFGEDMINID